MATNEEIKESKLTAKDFASDQDVRWCPGCGDYSILAQVQRTFPEIIKKDKEKVVWVSGIGCSSRFPYYMDTYGFHGIHGRAAAIATGVKIANPDLDVWVATGDGDLLSIGGNHFIHAMRRNHNLTYLVHDNQVYALTKGQASPTSDQGFITKTTPYGAAPPVNPIALGIIAGASLVARGFSGNIEHLTSLIKASITHKGFALIDILQPCVSFNHVNTFSWYKERVYKVEEEAGYDSTNRTAALVKAEEWGQRIPIGVIYKADRPTYEEQLPALKKGALVGQKIEPGQAEKLLDELL